MGQWHWWHCFLLPEWQILALWVFFPLKVSWVGCELIGDKKRLWFLGRTDFGTGSNLGDCNVKAGYGPCLTPTLQTAVSSQRGLRWAGGWWWRWRNPTRTGADEAWGSGLSLFQQASPLSICSPTRRGLPAPPSLALFSPSFLPKLEKILAVESDRPGLKTLLFTPTSYECWWSYDPSEPQFPCLKPSDLVGSWGRALNVWI